MVKKDVEAFLNTYKTQSSEKGNPYFESISVLSKAQKDNPASVPLVDSNEKLYDFDELTKILSGRHLLPSSVDGMIVSNNIVYFIEFKQGFKKKITKENFDKEKMTCKDDKTFFCHFYKDVFFENKRLETEDLKSNLLLKAAESYTLFEKNILPQCNATGKKIKLNLIVVMDGNADEELEFESGGKQQSNIFYSVQESLKSHFSLQKDQSGHDFYYDRIEVYSAKSFKFFIQNVLQN